MLYAVHDKLGRPLYAYASGLEGGFTSVFGMQTAKCQYLLGGSAMRQDPWPYTALLQFFCKGELDGLYMQTAWDLFVEEQLSVSPESHIYLKYLKSGNGLETES